MSQKLQTSFETRITAWWQPKLALLMSHCYLVFAIANANIRDALSFAILFLVTSVGFGFLGHLINDWADIDADRISGKNNFLAGKTSKACWLFLFTTLGLALLPWLILPVDKVVIGLLMAELVLFVIYALKPFRLKEKGIVGLFADSLYAFVIPAVLVFYAAQLFFNLYLQIWIFVLLSIWMLAAGVFNILLHQMEDREADLNADQNTFAVRWGRTRGLGLAAKLFLPLQYTAFLAFGIYVSVEFAWWYFILPAGVVVSLSVQLYRSLQISTPVAPKGLQLFNIHYHKFLPLWNIVVALLANLQLGVLIVFHLLLFHFGEIKFWLSKIWNGVIKPTLSPVVNHSIYYFRRLVLRQDVITAHGQFASDYKKQIEDRAKRKQLKNIALVNRNQDKYTETFVKRHLNKLPFYVHFLYGGYLPENSRLEGHFLSNHSAVRKFLEYWQELRGLPEDFYLRKRIKKYLLKHNVRLVLAEFGQSGAEMTSICREAGIPLIVIFHAYDAYNRSVQKEWKERYREMFQEAVAIVAVSQDLKQQLNELGAPEEKLYYLPCGVDFERFQYTDHSNNSPVFLSVGRFCDTKSPHITILAFREVLQQEPSAKLVMVGNGELLETCVTLVRSLGISGSVIFKGVLSPEKVYREMQEARVFVQHSITTPIQGEKEGTPVAIMEAMATGLPIVSTNHGGIADVIKDGETGFLVDELDYRAMAEKMMVLLNDLQKSMEVGKNASVAIRNNQLVARDIEQLSELIRAKML